ncbi:hypothetical protein O181_112672 [Austropuccinia psidii MF-1]|uniref:Uncharacterized protein n=1 Tax=Austropuccinia psidii MF-1 TaxID=1389203 RepID=A0A9Q3K454_9BASI|nr:hypothetical protein [Austropuccinia psidii MF-1]
MNSPSFVSPFSWPGFRILNDNPSFAEEGKLQYESQQSIYMNEHQYQQLHANKPEGFFNAIIIDSPHYRPTDQSLFGEEAPHPRRNFLVACVSRAHSDNSAGCRLLQSIVDDSIITC